MSLEPFVRSLSTLAPLDKQTTGALHVLAHSIVTIPHSRDALTKGECPSFAYIVLEGWAGRYGLRPNGTRRITGIMLPGNFCGLHAFGHASMDHSITALTDCKLAQVRIADIGPLVRSSEPLQLAICRAKLIEEAMLRVWLLNCEDAFRTLAHLICELDVRINPSLPPEGRRSFEVDLTQEQIGDVLGLTAVHTNRMFRQLDKDGLVHRSKKRIEVPDISRLRKVATFNPAYLQLA